MCGIAGAIGFDVNLGGRLEAALRSLQHRGPDDVRQVSDRGIAMGVTRLAIVDRARSVQPLVDAVTNQTLAFNGEIFNYRELRGELLRSGCCFDTDGDTEVLFRALQHWGVKGALVRLRGQFAFAYAEPDRRRLWLARDRVGILPLFYRRTDDLFCFGSSATSVDLLSNTSGTVSPEAALQLFATWGLPPGRAVRTDMAEVKPAHFVEIDVDSFRSLETAYWSPFEQHAEAPHAGELWPAVENAVGARVSDEVLAAVALSGGVDSVGVAAAASRHGISRAYGIRFLGGTYDEGEAQRCAADALGLDLVTVGVTPSDLADNLERTVRAAESPLLRMAPVGTNMLAAAMASDDVRVALTGEGADELFGGYAILKRCAGASTNAADELPADLSGGTAAFRPPASGRSASRDPLTEHRERWALVRKLRAYVDREAHDWIDRAIAAVDREISESIERSGACDAFDAARLVEFTTFLPGALLASQSDRQFMDHSVEGRYPYLDENVVEIGFACRARDLVDVATGDDKIPLRRAVASVAGGLATRRKLAYTAPIQAALTTTSGAALCNEYLAPDALAESIFRPSSIAWLVRASRSRKLSGEEQRVLLFALTWQILVRSN